MESRVPFHQTYIGDAEITAVTEVLRSGNIIGDGPVGRSVEGLLRELCGVRHAMLTTSCTHAMELALAALDVGPGDEVICPSFTFPSTANAIVLQRAKPVFAEVDDTTCTLSPEDVERKVTPRTKVIMPVHYAGVAAPMDDILEIAARHGCAVVEDAAQGVGAKYRGRWQGTLGDIGCYSFHGSKNVVSGEGGALLTNNSEVARVAELMREKGTNRAAFLRGEIDKYTWVERGSSYVMADILAAVLRVQLSRLDEIIARRGAIHAYYMQRLSPLQQAGRLRLPVIPDECGSNWHIFYIRTHDLKERDSCLAQLRARGIEAAFHYVPLHSSPFGRRLGYAPEDLPVTEHVSDTLIRLPIYPTLTRAQQDMVIDALYDIFSKNGTDTLPPGQPDNRIRS